ncbi:MAG: hypothetical protein RMJ53_08620 [Chitinophagales bacterium]|nr:hypothetical protein [Chitinophagales bacterium]MDW8274274.1 hypothetical protein [Chitinophagales bacterium]
MKNLLIPFIFLLATSGCNYPTSARIEKISPSGKVKVTIEASRLAGVEPWKVTMKVKAYNFKEGQLTTEITSDYLDEKTVSFNWFEESSADIVFKQKNGTERTFRLISSPRQLQFAEMPTTQ